MIITNYFKKFFQIAQSSGNLLIICVILSLLIANSSLGSNFQELLDFKLDLQAKIKEAIQTDWKE